MLNFKAYLFDERKIMLKKSLYILFFLPALFNFTGSYGQIVLKNPSFEDTPADATIPKQWKGCTSGTTPDILPGFWGVYQEAAHGNTYVGLITREDGSVESIGQKLSAPLQSGECYQFSLKLAFSEIYAGYNEPVKLRIWLSDSMCSKGEKIFESPFIRSESWKTFQVKCLPRKDYQYILFEAFYKEGKETRRGNILIDDISSIKMCIKA